MAEINVLNDTQVDGVKKQFNRRISELQEDMFKQMGSVVVKGGDEQQFKKWLQESAFQRIQNKIHADSRLRDDWQAVSDIIMQAEFHQTESVS